MWNIGNCWLEVWLAGTAATVPSATPAPADGATVTTGVAGLVTVGVTGFVTACGLMSIVCIPELGTSADGRLCNSWIQHCIRTM